MDIKIITEGLGFTLYINDLSFGWGDWDDVHETLGEIIKVWRDNEDWNEIVRRYHEVR